MDSTNPNLNLDVPTVSTIIPSSVPAPNIENTCEDSLFISSSENVGVSLVTQHLNGFFLSRNCNLIDV